MSVGGAEVLLPEECEEVALGISSCWGEEVEDGISGGLEAGEGKEGW